MGLDLISFTGPDPIKERSASTVTARFNDSAAFAGVQPTNVYYRLDDDGTGVVLQDWTSVPPPIAPANSVAIALTADNNRIINSARDLERRTLTVMANRGLANQFVGSVGYVVRNLGWFS